MIVKELITKLGFKTDQKALGRYQRGMSSLRSSAFAVTAAVAGISAGVVFLAKKAGMMEQIEVAFETMTGSAEQAHDLIKKLTDFAAKTPFELEGIFTTTKLLMGMGIEVEDMIPTLKALGDVSAGLSVPIERLALNFGQIKAQGKLTGRELRDFAVAGVPLLDELAKMLKISKEAVTELVSKGKVSFGQVDAAFKSMSGEGGRFNNLMIKQSKTLLGLWSNFKDFLTVTSIEIGKELLPVLKGVIKQFMNWAEANQKLIRQQLGKYIKAIASGIQGIVDLATGLGRLNDKTGLLSEAFWALFAVFVALKTAKMYMMFADLAQILKVVGVNSGIAATGIKGIGISLGVVAGILVGVMMLVDSIRSLSSGKAVGFVKWARDARDYVKELSDTLSKVLGFLWKISGIGIAQKVINFALDKSGLTDKYIKGQLPDVVGLANDATNKVGAINPNGPVGVGQGSGGVAVKNDVKNEIKIEVNVESGANAQDIGEAVRLETEDILNSSFRNALRAQEEGAR